MTEEIEHKRTRGNYAVAPRLSKALMLLASGESKTQQDACKAAGMTTRAFRLAVKKPSVQAFMTNMIKEQLGISAMRAATRMGELLSSPNEMASFRAAAFTLATGANVAPPTGPAAVVNVNLPVGYVVDLTEPDEVPNTRPASERAPVTIDHEPTKPTSTPRPAGNFAWATPGDYQR